MFERRVLKRNTALAIIVTLMLSILFNIYMVIRVNKYKYKIGLETYSTIESMRFLHDNNVKILSTAIDVGGIDNMGVLKLYKNFKDLAQQTSNLWSEYIYYEQERKFTVSKKNIDTTDVTVNDVNTKLEDFFNNVLEHDIQTKNERVELTGDMLDKFKEIYELESEKSNYYYKFCEEKLNGAVQDEKKDIIVKEHYWMDILQGYNDINKKYIDYEFKIN